MNEVAANIQRRANEKGISIANLCREAGISRAWFEHFKRRVPDSVEKYLKIDGILNGKNGD